jgi:hypothetical protein
LRVYDSALLGPTDVCALWRDRSGRECESLKFTGDIYVRPGVPRSPSLNRNNPFERNHGPLGTDANLNDRRRLALIYRKIKSPLCQCIAHGNRLVLPRWVDHRPGRVAYMVAPMSAA